jgi:hypothetical protein
MADGQDLNSLSRFRKQPGRLVLEEYSHCEVPAGCGGVVLRWRNPLTAVPILLYLYTPVPAACFLDQAEVRTGRADLSPGRHVVGLALENADLSAGLVLFAAVRQPTRAEGDSPDPAVEAAVRVLTADDGTWKGTLRRPANLDWLPPDFDDRDWLVLTRTPLSQPESGAAGAFRYGECVRRGAECLGLPSPARAEEAGSWWQRLLGLGAAPPPSRPVTANVWIRKVFDIPPPVPRGSS